MQYICFNKGDPSFSHDVNTMMEDMEGQVILAGDLNKVRDGMIDKSRPSGKYFEIELQYVCWQRT